MARIRRRDRLSALAAAVAIAVAVLVVGGAFRWTQAVVALILAAALAVQLTSRRRLDGLSPLIIAIAVAAWLTAIQLIPLPAGVIEWLAPELATLRSEGVALAGASTWQAATMDPASTLRALAFFVILLGAATVALRLAAVEPGRRAILATVAGLCGFVAFTVGIHELLGARALFGIYTPAQANPPVLGPLLNPNHLGSLMAVGTVLAIGLFLYHRQSAAARGLWAVIGAGCGVVTFASLSRGAAIALVIGVGVTLGVVVAQRLLLRQAQRARPRFLTSSLPIGIVVTCGLVLVVYLGAGNVGTQLAETSLQEVHDPRSKFAAWRSAEDLIAEAPWLGVGRGAFEPAFTRVHPATAFASISHLENEYIQVVVDWGVPGALALALAMAWLCVTAIRRWRDGPLAAAALGALAVVAIQSNVDFGVELLGLALPVTAIAATLTFVPLREGGGRPELRSSEDKDGKVRAKLELMAVRGVLLAGLLAAAAVLVLPYTRTVAEDHEQLRARDQVSDEAVAASIGRHPLDYIGYAAAAEQALRARQGRQAMRLLNHALQLHPTHPGLHRMAARILYQGGYPAQAALEYAAALRGTVDPRSMLEEIVALLGATEHAIAAIPLDYRNVEVIARALSGLDRIDLAVGWLDRVLAARPRDLTAASLLYDLALVSHQLAPAERAARRRVAIEASPKARFQLATVLSARKDHREVIAQLDDVASWHGRVDDIVAAWFLLCNARAELVASDGRKCFHFMEAQAPLSPAQRTAVKRRLDALVPGEAGPAPKAPKAEPVTLPTP